MKIFTWNLLHRVHAENWLEPPPCGLAETERVEAIAARVDGFLADAHAVCLQEVSGDQLAALRVRLGARAHLTSACYPRLPKAKPERPPHGLVDLSEHLVVVTTEAAERVAEQVAPNDPGKGFLAVRTSRGVIVSTHVTWSDKGTSQLAALAAFARVHEVAVIGGDFNTTADVVMRALGEGFAMAAPPAGRWTRPHPAHPEKSQNIDHLVGRGIDPLESAVEDGGGLSDHNPVWARFD